MKNEAGRKNNYMPCVLVANQEDFTEEEWLKLQKRCYFVDYFTGSEWATILDDKNAKNANVHKSKIRKKVAGWIMAMARLEVIAPELLTDAVNRAREEYAELYHGDEHEAVREMELSKLFYHLMFGEKPQVEA